MKSVTMGMRRVVWLLLAMGAVFLAIGVIAFQFASGFDSIQEERAFRYTFLGTFGGMGAILIIAGLIVALRAWQKQRMAAELMSAGHSAWADVVDISWNANVKLDNQSLKYLRCALKHTDGNTYMFKSPYLRYDPRKLLRDGKVRVWFDPYDMRRYFVDVDGSMAENVIEV